MKLHVLALAALAAAGCGSPRSDAGETAAVDEAASVATAAPGPSTTASAIKPLPAETALTLKFKGTITAARKTADADPLGARSDFKILRSFDIACRMIARAPRGVGPDGPSPEQQAILDAADADMGAATSAMEEGAGVDDIEARAAACNDDFDCLARLATESAQDPETRRRLEAEEERNAGLSDRIEDAAARSTAVLLEPNWQFLAPDVSPYGDGPPACTGMITADDVDTFRFGFDGGDMGEGVKSRSGTAELSGSGAPEVWFDLKQGRIVIDAQLNAISATLASACSGQCEAPWPDSVSMNLDWATTAGEVTRLEKGGVATIPGKWLFASEILPEKHQGFSGGGEFEVEIEAD
jgi:hypothetical protein